LDRRRQQIPEAERAVLRHHRRPHGGGPFSALGTVNRGCWVHVDICLEGRPVAAYRYVDGQIEPHL